MSSGVAREKNWRLWYDDQCEVCQAGVAWLRWLNRRQRCGVVAIPLSSVLAGDPDAAPPEVPVEDLLRHLPVAAPSGQVSVGAPAVAALARLFPLTWFVGWLASVPGVSAVAGWFYRWVAANRYSLSRCRGGVCRSVDQNLVRQEAPWRAFQICRLLGWGIVAPLSALLYIRRLGFQLVSWWRTRNGVVTLLGGRLSIYFLRGGISWTVSLLFGELFTMIRYRSLLVDPGGTRMRSCVARHLEEVKHEIRYVVATHAHEEHGGNLELAAGATGARVRAHPRAIPMLLAPPRIPFMRRLVIGQPHAVLSPIEPLAERLVLGQDDCDLVQVIETPGHCDEHVSFYIPHEKLLLAGDAFMGTHFSSPNDDVDHHGWIVALERLLQLEIEVMIEAHGHVHTLREDVLLELERAGISSLASRRDPKELLRQKLDFLRWVSEQITLGERERLPRQWIQATVFPWTQRWSYESAIGDARAALVSSRAFGRHKVVRSFHPPSDERDGLPTIYELRWSGRPKRSVADVADES